MTRTNVKPAPYSHKLCKWCLKVVRVEQPSGDVEYVPVEEVPFSMEELQAGSHGMCPECAKEETRKWLESKKSNPKGLTLFERIRKGYFEPPVWATSRKKWAQAERLYYDSYFGKPKSKQPTSPFAVITTLYEKLGGKIKPKGQRAYTVKRTTGRRNPGNDARAVEELFERFHGFEPKEVKVVSVTSDRIPSHLINVGELSEVVYKSDKFDGRSRLYRHKFGKPRPTLAAGADGKLYIIGGNYTITERGIEG